MFSSGILDVVIGLIFIYLTLSLMVTAINEFIEARLRLRATDLERGLREMLQSDGKQGATDYTASLYNHPLIFSLFKGSYDPNPKKKIKRNLPSYIPARSFALALMDIVLPAEGRDTKASMQDLRAAVSNIGNSNVRNALLPLIDAAGNDIDKARANIEAWYNSSMERATGWYKRRIQVITVIIGFIVAVLINADTIMIGGRLASDVAMRDSLVAAAQEYAKAAAPSSAASGAASPGACNTPECRVSNNLNEIRKLGFALGWDSANIPTWDSKDFGNNLGPWFSKFLGWILTALAISLGAPFWFDLLNKFMLARTTLKPTDQNPVQSTAPAKT